MNPQKLLDQFLGPQAGAEPGGNAPAASGGLGGLTGATGLAGGLAAGGLLGLLVGNKKARKTVGKLAGGAVGLGGAAALGALAHHAYRKWQDQKAQTPPAAFQGGATNGHAITNTNSAASLPAPDQERFNPSAITGRDGRPFELALVKAMIAAANADGHICGDERQTIVTHVSALPLEDDEKAFVFDALMSPPTLHEIAGLADGPEQAAELYLASRLAIDPDLPAERAYLDGLARNLALPTELVEALESQAAQAEQSPMAA